MAKRFLLLSCILFLNYGLAQTLEEQTDSLLTLIKNEVSDSTKARYYNDLSTLHAFSDPQLSIQFAEEALALGKGINDYKGISNAYLGICLGHYYQGSSADTVLAYLKLFEEVVVRHEDEKGMMRVYWMYAMYHSNFQQSDKELEYDLKALEIIRKYKMAKETETGLLFNISIILLEQEKYSEAMEYLEEGLKIVQGDGLRADMLHSIGTIHYAKQEYDKALSFYKEAFTFYEKVNDKGKMAMTLLDEGRYYDQKNLFERANRIYFQALELVEKNEVNYFLPTVLAGIADHYNQRQNYQSAIEYGEQALSVIHQQQNYSKLLDINHTLQEAYAAIGDYEKAFILRGTELEYKDSVSNADLKTKVEALQTQFKVEQKETENELLKAEAATNQKVIQNRNITMLALLLGLLLIGSWAIVVFRANRQKQQYNEKLQATVAERTSELQKANKDLEQANYELKMFNYIASHNIKEPIRNIGSYVGLMFKKLPETFQLDFKPYFDTVKNSTAQLYTLVEDFSRYTKLSKEREVKKQAVNLNTIVDGLKMSLTELADQENATIINEGLPTVQTSPSLIHTILKNIIENGLKFNTSNNPTVRLEATEQEEYIEIRITDNGIGIEQDYQEKIFGLFKQLHDRQQYEGSGTGLAIAKLLMDKLGGTINIESTLGKGSIFILQLSK